ncbi:MAG: DAK2 domain-containing protein [Ruminococcaceae bacterium]|nr:DAK2 domain-containing protein [Oscillospiraceae bacterium]
MVERIDAQEYYNLIDYGIRNLSLYRDYVNDLNVFPVPDGDTGSNMVMTLQSGLLAIEEISEELSEMAKKFSRAVIFGARGNSGVIVSQFFKGMSEVLFDKNSADAGTFINALENGVKSAYASVANPVEGTVLTVIREGTEHVKNELEKGLINSIDDVIDAFLKKAKETLKNTPELLPVLKSAGVVDSGGAGIVYVFEGMGKYLNNEPLSRIETKLVLENKVDFSSYTPESKFVYGYCTEVFIQLLNGKIPFSHSEFRAQLELMGDSVVTVEDGDKVKVHVHTFTPEKVLDYCHNFGEFLTLKIENMNVQHSEVKQNSKTTRDSVLSVVTVAHDTRMKQYFFDMGADIVISADNCCSPSAADFVREFKKLDTDTILVFPNNKNTKLVAEQAAKLYDRADIIVVPTKSEAECYAALPMIDFVCEDISGLVEKLIETIKNVTIVVVAQATKNATYSGMVINKGDYVALKGERLIAVGTGLDLVAIEAAKGILSEKETNILTVFTGKNTLNDDVEELCNSVTADYLYTETEVVETENTMFNLVLSFE